MKPPVRAKIGLVDDDESVRFSTRALLAGYSFEVVEYNSAEALLADVSLSSLDCLVIDYRMTGVSGLQLLRELRTRGEGIPAVVLSGYLSKTEAADCVAAGATLVIDKPVKADALVAAVDSITFSESPRSSSPAHNR